MNVEINKIKTAASLQEHVKTAPYFKYTLCIDDVVSGFGFSHSEEEINISDHEKLNNILFPVLFEQLSFARKHNISSLALTFDKITRTSDGGIYSACHSISENIANVDSKVVFFFHHQDSESTENYIRNVIQTINSEPNSTTFSPIKISVCNLYEIYNSIPNKREISNNKVNANSFLYSVKEFLPLAKDVSKSIERKHNELASDSPIFEFKETVDFLIISIEKFIDVIESNNAVNNYLEKDILVNNVNTFLEKTKNILNKIDSLVESPTGAFTLTSLGTSLLVLAGATGTPAMIMSAGFFGTKHLTSKSNRKPTK